MKRKHATLCAVGALALLVWAPLVYLATLDAEGLREILAAGFARTTGHRLGIEGDLVLHASLAPRLEAANVRISNPAWPADEPWLTAERITARVDLLALLRGRIAVRRVALTRPTLLLETDARGEHSWLARRMDGPSEATPGLEFDVRAVDVAMLDVTIRDTAAGSAHAMRLDALTLRSASAGRFALAARGRRDGAPVDVRGEIGDLAALVAPEPYPVVLTAESGGWRAVLVGAIESVAGAPAFAGVATLEIDDAAGLPFAWARHFAPATGVAIAARLRATRDGAVLDDLSLDVAGARAAGTLRIDLRHPRPRVDGEVDIDRIDLDRLYRARGLDPGRGRAGAVFSHGRIDLSALAIADGRVEARVGEVVVGGTRIRDLTTTLALHNGRLEAAPVAAGFLGSRASGALTIDAASGDLAIDVNLSAARVPLRPALALLGAETAVEGIGDLRFALRAQGSSAAALAATLDGRARFLMHDGRARARKVEALVAGLSGLGRAKAGADAGWTPVECIAADLEIRGGVVSPTALVMDLERATLVGEGAVDLRNETISLKITPYPKSFTLNLAVPVWLRGDLAAPRYEPDKLAIARRVGALALVIFPPTAVAGLGALALAGAGTLGIGGAAAYDREHPCLRILAGDGSAALAPPGRMSRASGSGLAHREEPAADDTFVPGAMLPVLSVGAVDH